jgi:hypothetical protein
MLEKEGEGHGARAVLEGIWGGILQKEPIPEISREYWTFLLTTRARLGLDVEEGCSFAGVRTTPSFSWCLEV